MSCPSDSIDYAVMEHTQHAVVIPMSAGWSDVGSGPHFGIYRIKIIREMF